MTDKDQRAIAKSEAIMAALRTQSARVTDIAYEAVVPCIAHRGMGTDHSPVVFVCAVAARITIAMHQAPNALIFAKRSRFLK